MKLVAIAASAALTAGALAFAPAAPRSSAPATTVELGATVAEDGTAVRTVAGLADRSGVLPGEDLRDLATWVKADRRLVEAAGFTTVAASDACGSLDAPDDVATDGDCEGVDEEQGMDGSYSSLGPAGDLDGDGWDDLVEERYSFADGSTTVVARSGRDGTVLWEAVDEQADESVFGFTFGVPDVDGDGVADLLSIRYALGEGEYEESCTPTGCTFRDVYSEELTIRARNGATGAALASTVVPVSFAYEDSSSDAGLPGVYAGTYDSSFSVTNDLTALDVVDVDGDGTHALLLGTYSFSEDQRATYVGDDVLGATEVLVGEDSNEVGTRVALVDLVDGSEESVASTADDGLVTFAQSLVLDGADVLVLDRYDGTAAEGPVACVYAVVTGGCLRPGLPDPEAAAPSRVLLDADGVVWEQPLDPSSFFVYPAGGDLDGDGADDLLDARYDEESYEDVTGAIDGATGALLWTAPVAGGVVVDGELTAVRFTFEDQTDGEEFYDYLVTAFASRLDGASGVVLDEREVASVVDREDESSWQLGFISIQVASVDGGTDLVVEALEFVLVPGETVEECFAEEDGEEYCYEVTYYEIVSVDGSLSGVDGVSLAPLFSRALGGEYVAGVLDVDGDGVVELLLETLDEETFTFRTVAERLDGSSVWVLEGAEFVVGTLPAPGSVTIVTVDDAEPAYVGRAGDDLAQRWRVPVFG